MKSPNKNLTVMDTKKYGKGVFAVDDINKGEVLHLFGGERLDVKKMVQRVISKEENIDDQFQIGKRTYLVLDEFSRTFNHSCNPNGGIRKTGELFALRDIKPGEEVTYDYSLTVMPTEWEMKCMCGSNNCRKSIKDVLSIPTKRRKEYLEMGAVQNYMKSVLKDVEAGTYKMPKYETIALEKLKLANI